jgi:high-affinity Fe2+/Pb2+ permease
LREERVERDLALCEPLNEGVGFFMNLNLETKSCVSRVLLYLLVLTLVIYLLIKLILFRYLSLGLSLVVLILTKKYSSCSLVGRISNYVFHSLTLFYVTLSNLFQVSNNCVVFSLLEALIDII